jgi:hypothetical protein
MCVRQARSPAALMAALMMALWVGSAAGCGDGTGAPDGGTGDDALDGAGTADLAPGGNPYAGTCLESIIGCFDWTGSCVAMFQGDTMSATFANGARFDVNTTTNDATATSSAGQVCWMSTGDPNDPTATIYMAGGSSYTVTDDNGEQVIACPDGTTDRAPGDVPPFVDALGMCTMQ